RARRGLLLRTRGGGAGVRGRRDRRGFHPRARGAAVGVCRGEVGEAGAAARRRHSVSRGAGPRVVWDHAGARSRASAPEGGWGPAAQNPAPPTAGAGGRGDRVPAAYSTLTALARLRGLSRSWARGRRGTPVGTGSRSSSFFGTALAWSAFSCSWWATARIWPLRALISSVAAGFFSSRSSSGTIATVGSAGSIRASGPCLSSEAG